MDLGERYARLALAFNQHVPGYLDSFTGPREWMEECDSEGKLPLVELSSRVEEFSLAIEQDENLEPQRKDYLLGQARAMQTQVRLLQGDRLSLVEETEGIYDICPSWVNETVFNEAHKVLNELLPAGGSLTERLAAYKKTYEVSLEPDCPHLDDIAQELRLRTRKVFGLPAGEMFELALVSGKPWSAYNWFLGGLHSRIEINTEIPVSIVGLAGLLAHEGYPGHHSELASKEYSLALMRGWDEHLVQVLYAPSAVISEGIAARALESLIPSSELEDWYNNEVLPRAGLGHLPAGPAVAIERARRQLVGAIGNAAFMMHQHHAPAGEILAYLQHYHPASDKELIGLLQFIQTYRSYAFTYHFGGELLDQLFAVQEDRQRLFRRLLREPVTPRQVREWMEETGSEEQ